MDLAQYRIVVEIYEKKPYPVVVHTFYGMTHEEALAYYQAHLQTDKFFSGCVLDKKFGKMTCSTQQIAYKRRGLSWVKLGAL